MDRKELSDVLMKSVEDASNIGREGYKPHFRLEESSAWIYLLELNKYYAADASERTRRAIVNDVYEYLLHVTDIRVWRRDIPPFLEGAAMFNLPLVFSVEYAGAGGVLGLQALAGGGFGYMLGAGLCIACAIYCLSCVKKFRKVKDAVKKQKTNFLHDKIEKAGAEMLPEILDANRGSILPYLA